MSTKRVLFVVAHPDDETLMGGGFISWCSRHYWPVAVATLAADASARSTGSGPELIASKQAEAFAQLDIEQRYNYTGRDSNLINEDHLRAVQWVEWCIQDWQPDIIITHYPEDTHSDHRCVSRAVQEAFRYFQRPAGQTPLEEVWYGEVPSSTDWSLGEQFHPNVWINLEKADMTNKLKALALYHEVIRPMPHPRSVQNLKALASYRGAQGGCQYAEAFQQVFRVLPE